MFELDLKSIKSNLFVTYEEVNSSLAVVGPVQRLKLIKIWLMNNDEAMNRSIPGYFTKHKDHQADVLKCFLIQMSKIVRNLFVFVQH